MEDLLKILLPKSEEEIKNIWDKAIFVTDTNVLLSLYKYTNSTRGQLLKILDKIGDKLWIPHQVALEFLYNRSIKIHEQEEDYKNHLAAIEKAKDKAKKEIDDNLNQIKKSFRKFDTEQIKTRIDTFFEELKKEIEEDNSENPNFYEKDEVLETFKREYRVFGGSYSKERLDEIYSEGEERYKSNIPPGYADLKDKQGEFKIYGNTTIKNEYGDLILWNQIIDKAIIEKKPVVFISDDVKEDWREKNKGMKVPRKELINEFFEKTKQQFLMYTTESFLKHTTKYSDDWHVNSDVIEEVHETIKNYKFNNGHFNIIDIDEFKSVKESKEVQLGKLILELGSLEGQIKDYNTQLIEHDKIESEDRNKYAIELEDDIIEFSLYELQKKKKKILNEINILLKEEKSK
ncbi:PIN-like domain-containing protein [Paenibacillus amylolyticus]|uniref:PIN-like domain-containing protein n=1 Tax=Paenibacillus amylolyticus TaxID=1451 RepID=UPI00249BAA6E|nr:PIN-like domain-containing protein [Paenibacillus amylolyticus]WFA86498.1 PIN domain-containing protein [Paenibacillus amylolyticus]